MTATSPTTPQKIDSSCRLPLFALFGGAAVWLALSSVFGLLASIKFHAPGFHADCVGFSYGRVYPAWSNLLVYGFCIPAGLGVGVWLLARLGRVELRRPWLVTVGAKLWHLGVFVGLIGILHGDSTGHEWLEMPRYAAVILFFAFLLIALWAFVTSHERVERALYPSQWFVLAALFWFPWIYSTATLLLQFFPVRGLVQSSVAWWFSGNLLNVWLPLAGLASTFYFVPKLAGRPLQSHYLALFAFLTLILFGTWTGIPAHVPLPAWMPSLSGAAGVMALVPALAVVVSFILTMRGGTKPQRPGTPLCFTTFGVWSLVFAAAMLAASAVPEISRVTNFTWFGDAQTRLLLYGFFAMTMFGAAYYILPRVSGIAICPNRIRAHFWLNVAGVFLLTVFLAIAGVKQGFGLLNAEIPFPEVSKSTLMFFRISTVGEFLLLVGNLLFLFNVLAMLVSFYRTAFKSAYAQVTAPLEPAGVQS